MPSRPLLLRHYAEDWGLDRGGGPRLRNVDFLVDGETIRPNETAVWAEDDVPVAHDAELAARGYVVLRRDAVAVGPLAFAMRIAPRLVQATALLVRAAGSESRWLEPVRALAAESLFWRELARRVRPRALVLYNDLHPTSVARTLALRRAGCATVAYEFSCSWVLDEDSWIPDAGYGFAVLDAVATWGPLHSEHLRNHHGAIGECWEVGCLWSEHARRVRDEAETGAHYRRALEREHGVSSGDFERVVGVFDDSPSPLFLGPDDLLAFYAGVASLAQRLPRVLFLCKPKLPAQSVFAAGVDGCKIEAALAAAANVVVLDNYFETAAVVGLCDLSIAACFTSPAVETIGAGRPSVPSSTLQAAIAEASSPGSRVSSPGVRRSSLRSSRSGSL